MTKLVIFASHLHIILRTDRIDIKNYTYSLPEDRIAKYPLDKRENSKLLIYSSNQETYHKKFVEITEVIPSDSILVYNNTRVIHARLKFFKSTGARIEIFCLSPYQPLEYNQAFQIKNKCIWSCMIGNLKKWKDEELRLEIEIKGYNFSLNAIQSGTDNQGNILVTFNWAGDFTFAEILNKAGRIPIPPYLNRNTEAIDMSRYQTVYSEHEGSVAAPTAGLHFTKEIIEELKNKGVKTSNVTLHVGAGTFQPVKTENVLEHKMHGEQVVVSKELLKSLINSEGSIIATGTTSLRTLESIYWLGVKYLTSNQLSHLKQWEWKELEGTYTLKDSLGALLSYLEKENTESFTAVTEIMIIPGYNFQVVDILITNFHQPNSTLILLVAAFIGENWKNVYDYALQNNFRFLSYGDSSILFRTK